MQDMSKFEPHQLLDILSHGHPELVEEFFD